MAQELLGRGRTLDALRSLTLEDLRRAPVGRFIGLSQRDRPFFSKWQSYYVSSIKAKAFQCKNCIWWVPPGAEGGTRPSCRLVSTDGDPTPGEIVAGGSCALWMAGPARIRLQEAARGRGASVGRLPGNLRFRFEEALVAPPRTVPPPEVTGRLLVKGSNPFAFEKRRGRGGAAAPPVEPPPSTGAVGETAKSTAWNIGA